MDKVVIDFTGCKYLGELHLELKNKLQFPDFYGENLDALWDCITGMVKVPDYVQIKGIGSLKPDIQEHAMKIYDIFDEAKKEFGDFRSLELVD